MVKTWTALHGQTLINLSSRRFKMPILRQLHIFTVRQAFSESLCYGRQIVVAMCRRGVLNSKSKRFFAIWPLT